MKLLEYINSEDRSFFLPDMGTNGLFLMDYTAYEVYKDPNKQLEMAKKMNKVFETAQAAADQYVESVKSMAREEIREYMKRKIDG